MLSYELNKTQVCVSCVLHYHYEHASTGTHSPLSPQPRQEGGVGWRDRCQAREEPPTFILHEFSRGIVVRRTSIDDVSHDGIPLLSYLVCTRFICFFSYCCLLYLVCYEKQPVSCSLASTACCRRGRREGKDGRTDTKLEGSPRPIILHEITGNVECLRSTSTNQSVELTAY